MTSGNTKFLVQSIGGPLEAVMTPEPTIQEPTEVLIRIKAVAINPADYKVIDQGHLVSSWPALPGLDGAGIVEDLGSAVTRFVRGDKVVALFFPGDRCGSYQHLSVVKEHSVAKIPTTLPFEEAAILGNSFFTGMIGLGVGLEIPLPFLEGGSRTGFTPTSVLVLGGSSSVGSATIQLLRLAVPDCNILATSSPKHHNHLTKGVGATTAIDRDSPMLVADVKLATSGSHGVDAIIDVVGAGATQRDVFDTLDPNGPRRYAQVWTGDDEIQVPSGVNSVMYRGLDIQKLQGGSNLMAALTTLLQDMKYKPHLPAHKVGQGLKGLQKGVDLMRKGVSGEKLVVTV